MATYSLPMLRSSPGRGDAQVVAASRPRALADSSSCEPFSARAARKGSRVSPGPARCRTFE
jgi:hypothetical protein